MLTVNLMINTMARTSIKVILVVGLLSLLCSQGQATIYKLVSEDDTVVGLSEDGLSDSRGFPTPVAATAFMSPAGNAQPTLRAKGTSLQDIEDLLNLLAETGGKARSGQSPKPTNRDSDQLEEPESTISATNGDIVSEGNSTGEPEVEIVPPRIAYSKATVNRSYKAMDSFNPRGMEHLYQMTNLFLKLVHREQEMPPELGSLVSQEIKKMPVLTEEDGMRLVGKVQANWHVLVLHYIGLVALMILGLLVAVIMPFTGLIFLCCRCAGRCGAEEPHYDKRRDPCKRATLGTFLTTFVVVVLLGLVCAFVTNARIEEGVTTLPSDLRVAIHDTRLYLTNTHSEVNNLFVANYRQLQTLLFTKLDSSGELVKSELARVTKAVAVDNLTAIATSLTDIQKDLAILRNTTHQLQKEKANLQNGLSDVASRLRKLKDDCDAIAECQQIMEYAQKLQINTDFSKLPDVETKLNEVSNLIGNDIVMKVKRGKNAFDHIATEIQNKVQRSIPDIKDRIKGAGRQLENAANAIAKGVNLNESHVREAHEHINFIEHYISEYAMYRYWGFFGLCGLLLLITLCFTFGVVFGCCGRRPDEATSCHKTTGATWLMCGVGLTFLFSAVIMVITTALFAIGSVSEILVCDPLRDPANSEVFGSKIFPVISDHFNLNHLYPSGEAPNISDIISTCHKNASVYSVLSLDLIDGNLDELRNYRKNLKLDEKVAKLKQKISIDTKIEILSKEAKQQLRQLARSSIAKKETWDYYTDILDQQVLTINLIELASLLNRTADQLSPNNASAQLTNDAIYLEGLQRWLSSIHKNTRILKETTARLNESLKFNKTSLNVAIRDLISEAEFAQKYLGQNGSKEIVALVDRFSQDFLSDVDDYVEHVEDAMGQYVGRCGPMSRVYNATTSAVCKDILYPFNGFWASVGWCFVFFIPCMILAVYLASLYRKTEPYPGPLNESGYDKKQRRRSREYEGGPISGSYSSDPHHVQGPRTSPPRNFEPSDGGPPRYTSQPSLSPEYERPPPYYYPGPGNA